MQIAYYCPRHLQFISLNWNTAVSQQSPVGLSAKKVEHQYVMRSFDFANFDKLFTI